MGLQEIKKLLHTKKKEMVSKLKRPSTEWERNIYYLYL
jgi:hypothetical protein